MEVIKERLEREFDLDLLATAPSVEYHAYMTNGRMVVLHSPQDMPDPSKLDRIEEPYLKVTVLVPPDFVGAVMELADRAPRDVHGHAVPLGDAPSKCTTRCRCPS